MTRLLDVSVSGHHAEDVHLSRAQAVCTRLTRERSSTFYFASLPLPRPKRDAVRALYAFCRVTDDLVDEPSDDPRAAWSTWRRVALARLRAPTTAHIPPDTSSLAGLPSHAMTVLDAFADTVARFEIPLTYCEQLLDGVGRDLDQVQYRTFDELSEYCYGVASTVGLMSMHIIGGRLDAARPYAEKLGIALQMTNILRDVGEDLNMGRLYLPEEDLRRFRLAPADVTPAIAGDPRWRAYLQAEVRRVRRIYSEALPGFRHLSANGRVAAVAAAELYMGLLDSIERSGGDVFRSRAGLSYGQMLGCIPRVLARAWVTAPGTQASAT